jgi:asparagine synthase (glutamine-hydrolysing)
MSVTKQDYEKMLPELRSIVNKVVQKNMAEGILFSAGTDTSIIAYEAVKFNPDIKAFTVAFKQGKPRDTEYVKKMVDFLKLDHEFIEFDIEEAVKKAEDVVKVLKTYDTMDVRNTLPAYIGMTVAKQRGVNSVITGDALDELFGYPWQFHLSETEFAKALSAMWATMTFSSVPMGNSIGVTVKSPYRDPLFMEYSQKLPVKFKVQSKDGVQYGKWLMRKAYDGLIPDEVVWRGKAPLEQGTGTWVFPEYFDKIVPTDEFEEKKKLYLEKDDVVLSSKEHLVFYEMFRKHFGKPSDVFNDKSGKQCPKCKGYIKKNERFCHICGNFPVE